ncbi:putative proline oxidase protein [Neofusicoccum parvum UCRNP2]|uniref:Proline dehydrogenase n=2 Tax=Neofusicoccum parvum TaxID=310453 RepID=R1EL63_BOTPV|nr:putative proline oxidase protein [Neofusicoccum parvum UCRNP2]GME22505.1 proline oxidase [Neofusicoccum parvum]
MWTTMSMRTMYISSGLPLTNVLRTYLITRLSSSPVLWALGFQGLKLLVNPRIALLDPDKNRALNWVLKKTFYSQFCAGENGTEVAQTTKAVKSVGYHGIILEYALEVLLDGIANGPVPAADSAETRREIEEWRRGMLQTVDMAGPGEFAALKWSGLGRYALHLLKQNQPPTPLMDSVIREVCDAAAAKNVALLPGAEEEVTNAGIDTWTLALERQYNRHDSGQTIMYNTYQAYLKSTPAKLASHLADAHKHGYTLGVKLVRGAYLASEPKSQVARGESRIKLSYAQLMGMADEIGCELVQAGRSAIAEQESTGTYGPLWRKVDVPKAYKCLCWGTAERGKRESCRLGAVNWSCKVYSKRKVILGYGLGL